MLSHPQVAQSLAAEDAWGHWPYKAKLSLHDPPQCPSAAQARELQCGLACRMQLLALLSLKEESFLFDHVLQL